MELEFKPDSQAAADRCEEFWRGQDCLDEWE